MKEREKKRNTRKIRVIAILLSLLLHALITSSIIWFPRFFPDSSFFLPPSGNSPQQNPEEKIAFEIIETPADIEQADENQESELASDKALKAADENPDTDISEGLPYAQGLSEVRNYPNVPEEENLEEKGKRPVELSENSFLAAFKRQQKLSQQQKKNVEAPFENLESTAREYDGFSFNTYDWNFAPYLITMKKRIRQNLQLPYAFTNLGAISGNVEVRFEVLPSGVVKALDVLKSNAHYSLEQSSVNAVRNSSAFDPLPDDFPEDRLIVTARFSFSVLRNN